MTFPWYTDAEIDDLCAGRTSNAAKARYLSSLGLTVHRKPNGRPLVIRAHAEAVLAGLAAMQQKEQSASQASGAQPNRAGMLLLFQQRKGAA
jgi:hypothetical protein